MPAASEVPRQQRRLPIVASATCEAFAGVEVEPRPYQQRIAATAIGALAPDAVEGASSVLIESPTGSGKTVMGLAIARRLQRAFGWSVGWVAMRRNLLAQADEENRRRGFGVELQLISMFERSPPAVDLLVIDEAQHDGAATMASLHATIRPLRTLGLSATPYRTDRVKLCFEKVIADAGIHALIQDGYLSRFRHFTLPHYDPATVAEFYLREPRRWGRSLVFFHRLEDCRACEERLRAGGARAATVSAASDRDRQLDDFAQGRLDVLLSMSILAEGFDCPELTTVFCRPSGRGPTIQMCGRVLRKHPAAPLKQIVQCRATRHPFVKTALADEQYAWMDGQWRSLRLNRQIAAVSEEARRRIAAAQVELPKLVTLYRPRAVPWRRGRFGEE